MAKFIFEFMSGDVYDIYDIDYCDTYVKELGIDILNDDSTADEIADIAFAISEECEKVGLVPRTGNILRVSNADTGQSLEIHFDQVDGTHFG